MRKSAFLAAGLVLLGAAAGALAQEPEPVEPQEEAEEAQPAPRTKIRVLQHPYDIASFYRSRQTRGEVVFGYDGAEAPLGRVSDDPYAIAGYYRSRQRPAGYGYSPFWTGGYGAARGRGPGYGRRIGRNGDLFLMFPTFFAPVGPLTETFELER